MFSFNIVVTAVDMHGVNNPPVHGVEITVRDSTGTQVATGYTDETGRYLASASYNGADTDTGEWFIHARKDFDFLPICVQNKVAASPVVAQTLFLARGFSPLICEVEVQSHNGSTPIAGACLRLTAGDGSYRGCGVTGTDGKCKIVGRPASGDTNSMDGWRIAVVNTPDVPVPYQTGSGCWVRPNGYRRSKAVIRLVPYT